MFSVYGGYPDPTPTFQQPVARPDGDVTRPNPLDAEDLGRSILWTFRWCIKP